MAPEPVSTGALAANWALRNSSGDSAGSSASGESNITSSIGLIHFIGVKNWVQLA